MERGSLRRATVYGYLHRLASLLPESARTHLRRLRAGGTDTLLQYLRRSGLAVYPAMDDYHYCPRMYGTSFHKLRDIRTLEPFGSLAKKVIGEGRTTLYYDRLYFIYQAICNASRMGLTSQSMAEVGVYKGGGTSFIASTVQQLFQTPPRIYSFDTFEGHPDDIDPSLDGGHYPGAFSDTSFDDVRRYLDGFDNVVLCKGRFQDRCDTIAGHRFSFVHIDVDIFTATRDCLDFFADSMVMGSTIIVDDYGFTSCAGAKKAVDDFVSGRGDFVHLPLHTGQCALIKIRGQGHPTL